MTDEDTVSKYSKLVGITYYQQKRRKSHWKDSFHSNLTGRRAYELMKLILPHMGIRRSSKIREIIALYENCEKPLKEWDDRVINEIIHKHDVLNRSYSSISKDYNVIVQTIINWVNKGKVGLKTNHLPIYTVIPSPQDDELFYIAGLLDGEGSFCKGSPSRPNIPHISIAMTDEDVIKRTSIFLQKKYYTWQDEKTVNKKGKLNKRQYLIMLKGKKAICLMKVLHPLMSARRQSQIEDAINSVNPNFRKESFYKSEKFGMKEAIEWRNFMNKDCLLEKLRSFTIQHIEQ